MEKVKLMKTKILHIVLSFAILSLGCMACSDEELSQSVQLDNGKVKIVYKLADSSISRVTEDGWNSPWNENKITRIDLFVFDGNGICQKHIQQNDKDIENATSDQTLPTNELSYDEVISKQYTYYMIANCSQLASVGKPSLTELEKITINPELDIDAHQTSFVMDGVVKEPQIEGTTATLNFTLARAAVKIRLYVQNKDEEYITQQCEYSLHNYVKKGTTILSDSEAYGVQGRESMTTPLGWDKMLSYAQEGIDKAVFYSYPNDWFDVTLLNDNGTFKDDGIYAKDDLIDEGKQTYIMLTYDKNEYKVPINFSISNDNDKTFSTDEEEIAYIKEIRDKYYRIKRNHIYEIQVTIDVETHEITIKRSVLVNAWNEKEEMDVTFGGEQ